ncbi:MAG: hypothetical protein FJY67_11250 [Calditrichaeota bacterium]|nr:hypothetical protein [Calditrichota bacterium]
MWRSANARRLATINTVVIDADCGIVEFDIDGETFRWETEPETAMKIVLQKGRQGTLTLKAMVDCIWEPLE